MESTIAAVHRRQNDGAYSCGRPEFKERSSGIVRVTAAAKSLKAAPAQRQAVEGEKDGPIDRG